MLQNINAYQDFYKTRRGKFVRKVLKKEIFKTLVKSQTLLGVGYTVPFVRRELNIMPACMRCDDLKSLDDNVAYGHSHQLPIESNLYDQVLMVHAFEHAKHPIDTLKESWRVLKSGGRLVMLVPNRNGLWARADHSPFGQGCPFSSQQVVELLSHADFAVEDIRSGLYFLPLRWKKFFKIAWLFEKIGRFLFVFPGGVHIVVAQKQIYSPINPSKGNAVAVNGPVKKHGLAEVNRGKHDAV